MKQLYKLSTSCALLASLLSAGCSPKIYTTLQQSLPAREASTPVAVYGMQEVSPDSALLVGSIQIKDTGFSTKCNYDQVINLALTETNRIGGNGFQITYHRDPSTFGSSCHRINGNVLQLTESNLLKHGTTTPIVSDKAKNILADKSGKNLNATIYLNAGYSFVISKMYLINGVTGNPKQGMDINGGFSLTSRSGFGGGLRFSRYITTLYSEGHPLKAHLNYIAPEFVIQQTDNRKFILRETVGIGYANYTEKLGYTKISTSGLGLHVALSVEYKIIPEIGIGAEAGLYLSRFASKDNFTQVSEQEQASGIARISLSGGLRFYF